MLLTRLLAVALLICATACAKEALAQGFPSKPIRIIASGVGGGGDFGSRLIA